MLQHPKPARPLRPLRRLGAAAVIEEHRADGAEPGVVLHPDGWYWVARDGQQQFGPFPSAEAARADRERDEQDPALDLAEAEDAIGINTWLDPETGEPAEGRCPPHLDTGDGGSFDR